MAKSKAQLDREIQVALAQHQDAMKAQIDQELTRLRRLEDSMQMSRDPDDREGVGRIRDRIERIRRLRDQGKFEAAIAVFSF